MPTPKTVPTTSEEQMEQLRALAEQEGGGLWYVVTTKVNDQGNTIHSRKEFLSYEDLLNMREWCAAWGGGGRYQIGVYSRLPRERSKPLEFFKVDIDPEVHPPVPVDELKARARVAADAQATAAASVASPYGAAPPWASAPGVSVTQRWWPQGGGWPPAPQPQQPDPQLFYLQQQLQEAKERANEERRGREMSEKESALRAELREMKEAFSRTVEKLSQPAKSATAEIASALAPVLAAIFQSQQGAQDRQTQLLSTLLQRDPSEGLVKHMAASRAEITDLLKSFEVQRTELVKLVTDARKEDRAEGMSKVMAASGQMIQGVAATLGTLMERVAQDEPAWKEPLTRVVDMLGSMAEAVASQAVAGTAPAPQLAGATQAPALPAPVEAKPNGATDLVQLRQKIVDAINMKSDPDTVAELLIQFCELVRNRDPKNGDVEFFWADPSAGTQRLLGPVLAQKGGEGTVYLRQITESVLSYFDKSQEGAEA